MKLPAFLPVYFLVISLHAQQTDTIHAGDGKLDLRKLPNGTQRYLVYLKNNDGSKRNIWLWERTTSREKWKDSDAIVIRQKWVTSDTGFNKRELLSVVDPVHFTPIYQFSENPKSGSATIHFNTPGYTGADPVAAEAGKTSSSTTFNWELDLETFPLFPLKTGRTYVINFVHPGGKTGPAWYSYTVTGTEKIPTVNGEMTDCYKLYIDYGQNRGNSTWWLSRKTHEVLKMEERFGTIIRYKIKLATGE